MKNSIFIVPVFVLLFGACQDDDTPDPGTDPGNCLLKMSTIQDVTSEYIYDDENRVSRINYGQYDYVTVSYERDKITVTNEPAQSEYDTYVYTLDQQGRIISASTDTRDSVFYTYNAEGYLSEIIQRGDSEGGELKYTLSYSDGNLTQMMGPEGQTVEFLYYDEPNQDLAGFNSPLLDLDGVTYNSPFLSHHLGKQNKNLFQSAKFYHDSEEAGSITLDYTKDADGKITGAEKSRVNNNGEPHTESATFEYECD